MTARGEAQSFEATEDTNTASCSAGIFPSCMRFNRCWNRAGGTFCRFEFPYPGVDSWDLVQPPILPRREVLRLFLRLRPRAAGILDLVEAVASTRPLLTSSSENTFPLLASDRATRMIFAKSGLRLRATDSLSKPLKDIRAATGFSFEVMTMDSESSSAV